MTGNILYANEKKACQEKQGCVASVCVHTQYACVIYVCMFMYVHTQMHIRVHIYSLLYVCVYTKFSVETGKQKEQH